MTAAAGVFSLHQPGASFPFFDQSPDDLGRYGWMIYQGEKQCFGVATDLFDPESNRRAHLAVRVRINRESHVNPFQLLSNFFSAMTQDDDYFINISRAKVIYAAFDHGAIAARKLKLERAHPPRASSGA